VLARLNQVVDRVTNALEKTDPYTSTLAVEAFLDDLTNWYVRRSRRRFWKSERDADKNEAYATLYHVLVKLSLILAPFTPFITEVMYRNLVFEIHSDALESVHHCDWPQADLSLVDQEELDRMALARQIASLGLSGRSAAGIKLRQPLSRVLVNVRDSSPDLGEVLVEILTDELNVKSLDVVEDTSELIEYRILPDNKVLGPRFGPKFPGVRAALAEADGEEIAGKVDADLPVTLQVDGEQIVLAPDEVLVETQPAEGYAVAAEKGITVAIDTEITPDLRSEGLARELVRRIQSMRKSADFNIEDRITTYYIAEGRLEGVIQNWAGYIQAETLSTNLVAGPPPEGAFVEIQDVDDEAVTIGLERAV
jgi:isoleucyl-tRNA synthetase